MNDFELFKTVTVQLCGTLDLAKGLARVFPILRRKLPVDELRLNILDTGIHAVKVVATVDEEGPKDLLSDPLILPLPEDVEEEMKGEQLEDIRIVGRIEEDRASSAVRDEYYSSVPESSLLIMRLTLDSKRQGALILRTVGKNRYHEGHKSLMSQLNEPFAIALNNALAHREIVRLQETLAEENRRLNRRGRSNLDAIIGASFGLSGVMELVWSVAPLETTVLLLGETGVGKEVIADAIHEGSPRREGPFVKINCGAIPDTLIDSELFGHEKGAFTGAISEKKGRFERARGGTLFLDEIGELPLNVQTRLLRVLQTKRFERVGGKTVIETDARIIAATHRDLEKQVKEGSFRQDLWYRINVFPLRIPPLRERKQDIPALVNHLIERKSREMGIYPPPALVQGAMERLKSREWPGNVRELQNTIERELILRRGTPLQFNFTSPEPPRETSAQADQKPEKMDEIIADHIRKALNYCEGKVGGADGAAELLGMNASTLRHRMRKLGIPFGVNR